MFYVDILNILCDQKTETISYGHRVSFQCQKWYLVRSSKHDVHHTTAGIFHQGLNKLVFRVSTRYPAFDKPYFLSSLMQMTLFNVINRDVCRQDSLRNAVQYLLTQVFLCIFYRLANVNKMSTSAVVCLKSVAPILEQETSDICFDPPSPIKCTTWKRNN